MLEELARELGVTPSALLPCALLLALRLAPIAWLAPYVAPIGSPAIVRSATLAALTTALLGVGAARATIPEGAAFIAAMVRELVVGLVIVVATSVPVIAFEHVGRSLDAWRPSRGDETYARLFAALAASAFVAIGGLRVVTRALGEGLVAVPLGASIDAAATQDIALASARIVTTAITFTASLAAPALVALFAAEVGIALAVRAGRFGRSLDLALGLRGGLVLGAALLAIAAALPELPALTRWAVAAVPH
jgi:type III secretory pathway component EscT